MPSVLSYPGVYIEEIPSGVRTISGVATSITAFIGRAAKGPVNEPIMINSFADFERIFGGLWTSSLLGFAVSDFYQNGGSQAVIVRLFETKDATSSGYTAIDLCTANPGQNNAINLNLRAASPGGWGNNLQVDVDWKVPNQKYDASNNPTLFNLTVKDKSTQVAEQFNNLSLDKNAASYIVNVLANQSRLIRVTEDVTIPSTIPYPTSSFTLPTSITDTTQQLFLSVIASEVNYVTAKVENVNGKTFDLTLSVHHTDGTVESESTYQAVSVDPTSANSIDKKLLQESKIAYVTSGTSLPNQAPLAGTYYSVKAMQTDGDDGLYLTANNFLGSQDNKTGLYALEKTDLFNLLCIPPYQQEPAAQTVDSTVISAAVSYCERRRAFFIIDPPANWESKDDAKKDIVNVSPVNSNAAVFFPRVIAPNSLNNNQLQEFVPCGMIAGIFSRIDAQRGIWKAPAGLEANLVGVTKFSVPLTDAEIGELNPLGLNCLRVAPAAGPVVWGARTREGDDRLASQWKYIPVRRMALYLEESLYRGTQWAVFEPNDQPLWSQLRLNIGSFMNNLFRQGAFQGKTTQEAYFVKCDSDTTTQTDIDNGIVNVLVGFAPLKPAEFVVIKIQQIAGQSQ